MQIDLNCPTEGLAKDPSISQTKCIRSKSQRWCNLMVKMPKMMQFDVCELCKCSAAWRMPLKYTGCQATLTYHVNIISKIQNGFLTYPEFFPSTSHHNFLLHLTFPFALIITDKFFLKSPKSNAELKDIFLQITAYCFENCL